MLIWLDKAFKRNSPQDIDTLISAEIPNPAVDPKAYEAVANFMIHGPCRNANPNSPCMQEGICTKNFPKDFQVETTFDTNGYCQYKRRHMDIKVKKNGIELDNRYVVPYNRYLLIKFQSHINVESCNQAKAIKYLFKYITKGVDHAEAIITSTSSIHEGTSVLRTEEQNEIKAYLDCRYLSACEAIWRIFEYDIHYRIPAVERLCVHLEGEQMVFFNDDQPLPSIAQRQGAEKTMLTEWMSKNVADTDAALLTYAEFPEKYTWNKSEKMWRKRKSGKTIGRITYVAPIAGERYFLRLLLNSFRGPTSYENIRTVNGIIYPTFKDACYALGLLQEDREWNQALDEASNWATGLRLRELFALILLFCDVSDIKEFWDRNWSKISEDILYKQRKLLRLPNLKLSEEQLKNFTLLDLQRMFIQHGRTLEDFKGLPIPNEQLLRDFNKKLLREEMSYDEEFLQQEHDQMFMQLTDEQKNVYEKVIAATEKNEAKLFFLYGYGGTGKTFVYKTIINKLRAEGKIVLAVASSGIAALLLPGGRTAHSRFKIPLKTTADTTCGIKQGMQLAELIQRSNLVIWDEAPMNDKNVFETVDKSMKDILRNTQGYNESKPFGGKTFLLGGDFRQILPVVPNGTRSQIVNATLNKSDIWQQCEVLSLTKNMRLQSSSKEYSDNLELQEFSNWLLRIGDGVEKAKRRSDEEEPSWIQIPEKYLIQESSDPLKDIFEATYTDFDKFRSDQEYIMERAILTPRNETVEAINKFIMESIPTEIKEYKSSDTIDQSVGVVAHQDILYPTEFLNALSFTGIPDHQLHLKTGVPIMLLRNLNQSEGMCNGTRMMITQTGTFVIEAEIISGSNIGKRKFIPRIDMSTTDSNWPFVMKRRQLPVKVCYAMTINKSQGQTLTHVGLYLPKPVFTHGQLYVALSRVKNPEGLKILQLEDDPTFKGYTKNIVYPEVFDNLL